MSRYFENLEESKSYISPDYSEASAAEFESPKEEDDDELDDELSNEDEGKIETLLDNQEQLNKKIMTTTPFGTPPSSGGSWNPSSGSSSPWSPSSGSSWGSSLGNNSPQGSNFWGGGNNSEGSSPWGSNSGSSWGTGNTQKDKTQLDRTKEVIICDFLDCIAETYQSQGQPGLIPRDIYDLRPRFEVWQKLQAFNPSKIYAIIPKNLIPNTNGIEGWQVMLEYFCCCLSSFLRVPFANCQILAQSQIGQPKEEIISSVINNENYPIPKDRALYVGIYSGLYGQSNKDYIAALNVGIDYLDLGQLLNNMY